MKFVEPSYLTDPVVAARKLVEIANAVEPAQEGRIYIELVNSAFLKAGGTPDQFRAGLARAITEGWLWRHESGTYVKFTPPAPSCSPDGGRGLEAPVRRSDPASRRAASSLCRHPYITTLPKAEAGTGGQSTRRF